MSKPKQLTGHYRLALLKLLLALMGACTVPACAAAQAQIDGPAQKAPPDQRLGINPWDMQSFLSDTPGYIGTNVGSIRIDLPWQQVQPRPGVFDWDALDSVVRTARTNGMDVLITLRAISSWGTKLPANSKDLYHGASLPLDMSRWETFVSAMADRYRGGGVAYEIENEPNSKFWSGTMDEYLTLLKATFAVITRSDPQARVLSGALACHTAFTYPDSATTEKQNQSFDTWQKAILATHAFNTIGVHDYYFPDAAVNGWTFVSFLDHVADLARTTGCDKCPIWVTETGYVSRPQRAGMRTDAGSPQAQARWAAEAFRQAFGHMVERVYWLFLKDHPNTGYFASMGLTDMRGTARPALAVVSHWR
jgi:Cellulase (glycosyl hydrolase family 5)